MKKLRSLILPVITFLAFTLIGAAIAPAEDDSAGTLVSLAGKVEVLQEEWATASLGQAVYESSELRTGADGKVSVVLKDESVFNLGPNSHVKIADYVFGSEEPESKSTLDVLSGKIRALVSEHYKKETASFNVRTVTATAGVRGTEFVVMYDSTNERTDIAVLEGKVVVRGLFWEGDDEISLNAGQATTVGREKGPSPVRLLSPEEMDEYFANVTTWGSVLTGGAAPRPDLATGQDVDIDERAAGPDSVPILEAEGPGPPAVVLFEDDPASTPIDRTGEPGAAVLGPGQVEVPF